MAISALSAPSSAVGWPVSRAVDEIEAELREHSRRGARADGLEAPGRERPSGDDGDEQHERRRDSRERGAVERACRDPRQEDGLREHEERRDDAEHGVGDERDAGGARTTEEARIERSHERV